MKCQRRRAVGSHKTGPPRRGGLTVDRVLRVCCTLVVGLGLLACDRGRADVLEEFPPPRLARAQPAATQTTESTDTDCKATWRLVGRKSRETYHLLGRGTFEVRGQPPRPTSGVVAFDPSASEPELREVVAHALQTRGQMAPWVWRVLSVDDRAIGYDGLSSANTRSGSNGLSELEVNGVRTRQTHDVGFKLTSGRDAPDELTFETQLRLDLSAHHVRGIVLADDAPPRRADLVIQCTLATEHDAE